MYIFLLGILRLTIIISICSSAQVMPLRDSCRCHIWKVYKQTYPKIDPVLQVNMLLECHTLY